MLDLKHSILQDCGLVKGRDVLDLELSDADTGVVYENDTSVGRDKAVLVKRVPIVRREALVSQRGDTSIDLDGEHDVYGNGGGGGGGAPSAAALEGPTEDLYGDGASATGASAYAAAAAAAASSAAPPAAALSRTQGRLRDAARVPADGALFEDAVITTCCGTSYSKPAILSRLESQGACPSCGTAAAKVKTLPNSALRDRSASSRRRGGELPEGGVPMSGGGGMSAMPTAGALADTLGGGGDDDYDEYASTKR